MTQHLYDRIKTIVDTRVPYKDLILKEYSKEDHYTTVYLALLDTGKPEGEISDLEIQTLEYRLWANEKMKYLRKPCIKIYSEETLETPLTLSPIVDYLIEAGKERLETLTT